MVVTAEQSLLLLLVPSFAWCIPFSWAGLRDWRYGYDAGSSPSLGMMGSLSVFL